MNEVAAPMVMDHLVRRECARADRNGEAFSLVLFRVGRSKRRARLACRMERTMLKSARLTDDIGWLGDEHIAALLPDTKPDGARAFADKVADAIAKHHARPLATVYSYPRDRVAIANSPAPIKLPEFAQAGAARNGKINGNGHVKDKANGKKSMNGHGFAAADRFGSLAVLEPEESGHNGDHADHWKKPSPTAKPTKPAVDQPPVEAIEELLAYPMPQWKRLLDIIGAGVLLVLLSPILAAAAIAIKLTSPGPAIFTQRRAGLGGKPFVIYKFRTMCVNAEKRQQELRAFNEQDGPAFKLTHDPRVTKVGHILRKTSIDELPQLWNVLRGEMSLVGPRPLPLAEQDGCEQWQRHRLNATPGLTCIWQVKGRSTVSFSEWVRMDVEYMRRRTIFHDLTILFSTIPSVLLRRGAR
jgi:lipopolysaccharide/colanic/teichoic acid biosynthesis glycosyltransferase